MEASKIVIVMPARNAALTLEKAVQSIPLGCAEQIFLVDNASKDDTVAIAQRLGLTVLRHDKDLGYGGSQKTNYRRALETDAAYVVMLHADNQYDARVIPVAVDLLKLGICDMVLGNRIRSSRECLASGMPPLKYLANRALTIVGNILLRQNLGELNSGFRVYRREVLESIPFEANRNSFVFDMQVLIQATASGFVIGDIPIPVRYSRESSSIDFFGSLIYGFSSLWFLFLFLLSKLKIVRPKFLQVKPKASS